MRAQLLGMWRYESDGDDEAADREHQDADKGDSCRPRDPVVVVEIFAGALQDAEAVVAPPHRGRRARRSAVVPRANVAAAARDHLPRLVRPSTDKGGLRVSLPACP